MGIEEENQEKITKNRIMNQCRLVGQRQGQRRSREEIERSITAEETTKRDRQVQRHKINKIEKSKFCQTFTKKISRKELFFAKEAKR